MLNKPINVKKTLGGFLFLILSFVYGWQAFNIKIFSAAVELFSARTIPFALSVLGIILSILLLVLPEEEDNLIANLKQLDWRPAILLLISMSIYGILFQYVGFFISTFLFLNSGFWILGERSLYRMFIISVSLMVVFWVTLVYLLDIYIDPGLIFNFLTPGEE